MLSRILLHPQKLPILLRNRCLPYHNFCIAEPPLKQITLQHINSAKTLEELIVNVNMYKIPDQQHFRPFVWKFTSLLEPTENPKVVEFIEKFMFELRKFGAELKADSYDLLNYALLFKKLKKCFPWSYRPEGFQVRLTMVSQTLGTSLVSEGETQAKSLALLHYMTTITELSKNNTKNSLSKYFIDYFMKKNQIFGFHRTKQNTLDTKYQESMISVDACAIILSCSKVRSIKIYSELYLDQLAIGNLCKRWSDASRKLGISYLIACWQTQKIYKMLVQHKNQKILVVNSERYILQSTDILVNLLKAQKKIFNHSMRNYEEQLYQLNQYFCIIFSLCENMEVYVSTDVEGNTVFKKIKLWGIAGAIVEALSLQKNYVKGRSHIYRKIFANTINFLQNHPNEILKTLKIKQQKQQKQQKQSIFSKYSPNILKILLNIPCIIIERQIAQDPTVKDKLVALLRHICSNLPKDIIGEYTESRPCLDLQKLLIKLYRMKGQLIMPQNQWYQCFNLLIKQDHSLQFWPIYYNLAGMAKNTPRFNKLIPLQQIVREINQKKEELHTKKYFLTKIQLEDSTYQSSHSSLSSQQKKQRLEKLEEINNYECMVLRLYGLCLELNIENQIFMQNSKNVDKQSSQKVAVSIDEVQKLLENWIKPFAISMASKIETKNIMDKQFGFKFVPIMQNKKPLQFMGKLFLKVFEQTNYAYQFRLINKIINHPIFDNYLYSSKIQPNINYHHYIKILLLGLADPANKHHYLKKYTKITNTISKQLRISSLFINMGSFPQYIYTTEQWSYFMELFEHFSQVSQAKDLWNQFLDRTNWIQANLYKNNQNKALLEYAMWQNSQKILQIIITKLMADFSYFSVFSILAWNFCYWIKLINETQKKYAIVTQAQKQHLVSLIQMVMRSKYQESALKEFSDAIITCDLMGFFQGKAYKKLEEKILSDYKIGPKINLGIVTILQKRKQMLSDKQRRIIESSIFKISAIRTNSFHFLLMSIRFSRQTDFQMLVDLIQNWFSPQERALLAKQLLRQKYKQNNLIKEDDVVRLQSILTKAQDNIKKYQQFEEKQEQIIEKQKDVESVQKSIYERTDNSIFQKNMNERNLSAKNKHNGQFSGKKPAKSQSVPKSGVFHKKNSTAFSQTQQSSPSVTNEKNNPFHKNQ